MIEEKIRTLLEALPYIVRFHNKTFVVKYGGSAMEEESLRIEFAKDMVLLKHLGINPVIVHGGGKKINSLLHELKIESRFIDGLRVTDEKTLEIVEMVLSGSINKEIVNYINQTGGKALGLSGKDGRLIVAKKVADERLGLVGEITEINVELLDHVSSRGYIPVIAPIAYGPDGRTYNVNADSVAGSIAGALKAEKLILLTDVDGVLDRDGRLFTNLKMEDIPRLVEERVVEGGMIPKLECARDALEKGVSKVHIINGKIPHAILLEIFTDQGIGTQISWS